MKYISHNGNLLLKSNRGRDNIFLSDPHRSLGLWHSSGSMCQTPRESEISTKFRFEIPNYLLSHQIISPVQALPSTPQETSFHPIPNQGLEPPGLCFMVCFQGQLWFTALGNIIWGFSLGNSHFPQTSRLHMNPKDQSNTSSGLYKPKTLKNSLKQKPETGQNLGIHYQHQHWADIQCRERWAKERSE